MEDTISANKKLNEWCGTEGINFYEGDTALGFLFKYAVPKVLHFSLCMMGHNDPDLVAYYVSLRSPDAKKIYFAEHKDPALTLFEAIYKALEGLNEI